MMLKLPLHQSYEDAASHLALEGAWYDTSAFGVFYRHGIADWEIVQRGCGTHLLRLDDEVFGYTDGASFRLAAESVTDWDIELGPTVVVDIWLGCSWRVLVELGL